MGNTEMQHGDGADPLPVTAEALLAQLRALDISYALHTHRPVFTMAESAVLDETIPGLHCRNLFLRDKKKRTFLVVAGNETRIDLKKLAPLIGANRLSFGSADRLWAMLGVRPGSVCPFAALNDGDGAVSVVLDAAMMAAERVNYHPMENHMTVGIAPDGLVRFLESCDHPPQIVNMAPAAPED